MGVSGAGTRTTAVVPAVATAVFLQWAGNNAMLPLLPLEVRARGGTDALIGAVMAAYFAAAVVLQYPAGRLADRIGRLPVFLAGQLVYAAGALLFLLPAGPGAAIAFRALQGAGAGAAEVAALALVARTVPLTRRGRAFAAVYGAGLAGMGVGPLLGSLAGLGAIRAVFVAAAVAALAACAPVVVVEARSRAAGPVVAGEGAAAGRPMTPPRGRRRAARRRPARLPRSALGAVLAAVVVGLTSGLYEACWTLLLHHRGATDWQVGLSWTLYAVPYAVFARPAGWLADHLDRRWLVGGALLWVLAFCAVYPWLPGVDLLLGFAVGESAGFALALPAAQSLLGSDKGAGEAGRAQGLFAAGETGATAVAAAGTGALFSVAPWLPFEVVAATCLAVVAALAVVWRPVAGRVPAGPPGGQPPRAGPRPRSVVRATSRTAPAGGEGASTPPGGAAARGGREVPGERGVRGGPSNL